MPIFNYQCGDCGKHFERIIKQSETEDKQDCPACQSLNSHKLMSMFGSYTIKGNNGASTRPKGVAGRKLK
jgi:putative FmdB family regulatory protein